MSDQELPVRALSEEDVRFGMLALKLAQRLRSDKSLVAELLSQTSADQSTTPAQSAVSPQDESFATTLADSLPEQQSRQAVLALKLAEHLRGDKAFIAELLSWASADQSLTPRASGASQQVEARGTALADRLPEEQAQLAALGLKLGQQVREGEGIVTSTLGQATSAAEPQPGHGLPENARGGSGRTDLDRGR